jgi:hypothetical protein
MERTFKVSRIQDTGLIAATLLNERGLKSTVERKVTCPESRLFGHVAYVPFSISALAMMRQSRISGQMSVSCCGHLRRPALDECSKAVERHGEIVSGGGKAQAEMRGRVEAIAGSQQDFTLGGGLAERSGVFSAH